jgi:hypothetical protein
VSIVLNELSTIIITVVLAIIAFSIVCGPMSGCHPLVRWFVLAMAISLIGASIDRIGKVFAAYDTDGSIIFFASYAVWTCRIVAVTIGSMALGVYYFNGIKAFQHPERKPIGAGVNQINVSA